MINRVIQWVVLGIFFPTLMTIGFGSCKKWRTLDGGFVLSISEDTLLFDTVFTRLGGSANPQSVYKYLVIRNDQKESVRFDVILAGGKASPFRINVDGQAGTEVMDYALRGKDSLFVFVEVYLDQGNTQNPFIIADSLIIRTEDREEKVKLVAWGQDAHYIEDSVLACNQTWTPDKPYVIYHSMAVDYGCKLTIKPGVKVYCYNDSRIYIAGTLEAMGDTNNPIVFQGSRLEYSYRQEPNQWRGIRILPQSTNNKMENVVVKNAIIGIQVDSLPVNGLPNLVIRNARILNMSQAGLVGYSSVISGENLLISNVGKYTFAGIYGGNYRFVNCTFASYNTYQSRKNAHFGLSNSPYIDYQNRVRYDFPLYYEIRNCIIYGDQEEEIDTVSDGLGAVTAIWSHNIVKVKDLAPVFQGNNHKINVDPQFVLPSAFNFNLSGNSPALNAADPAFSPIYDLQGFPRSNPDIGAFERP